MTSLRTCSVFHHHGRRTALGRGQSYSLVTRYASDANSAHWWTPDAASMYFRKQRLAPKEKRNRGAGMMNVGSCLTQFMLGPGTLIRPCDPPPSLCPGLSAPRLCASRASPWRARRGTGCRRGRQRAAGTGPCEATPAAVDGTASRPRVSGNRVHVGGPCRPKGTFALDNFR